MVLRKCLIILLLVLGLIVLFYPFMGSFYTQIKQTIEVELHNERVKQMDEESKRKKQNAMEEYNKKLVEEETEVKTGENFSSDKDAEIEDKTSLDDSIIGVIKIPIIDVNLPIYKDISEQFLLKGVGCLNRTSLPVGGESTHCVLTGHSAIPTARLFTDLEKLKIGDAFYIIVLDEVHAYKVDQIKVVLPTDISSLNVEKGKDYISLITCTPHGVNSHRLIVRGIRDDSLISDNFFQNGNDYWRFLLGLLYFIFLIILTICVMILIVCRFFKCKNKNIGKK